MALGFLKLNSMWNSESTSKIQAKNLTMYLSLQNHAQNMKAVPKLKITQLWYLKFGKFFGTLRAWINGIHFSYNYGGIHHKFSLMWKYLRVTPKILYESQTTKNYS